MLNGSPSPQPSPRGERGLPCAKVNWNHYGLCKAEFFLSILFLGVLVSWCPAHAEEKAPVVEEPAPLPSYSPDYCEFSITFPEEPYTTRRCDDDGKRCYDQVSYTKVFENLTSTVNFRVICNEIGADVIESYNGEVMEATLKAMTKRSVVETFETSFREEEHYKQAGLVGEGKSGTLATLYIAQLWIGQKSAFSVEAELIGEPLEAPDRMFSEILKSVGVKTVDEPEETEE